MASTLLHGVSFCLTRTNVKLSTNVKLVVDDLGNLYLDSFSANSELSNSAYKGFKIDPSSSYNEDICRFYGHGKFPKNLAYEVYQDYDSTKVLDDYCKQYEMFYSYGTEWIVSDRFSESLGIFAPLWLDKILPDYFVIFRVNEPVSKNSLNASSENEYAEYLSDPQNFIENVLKHSTLIKTVDLTEKSNIGKYIRNYVSDPRFPSSPLTFSTDRNTITTWNGISYDTGQFSEKGEFIYDSVVNVDSSIIETEYLITKGFERNGIICANLLNLQFLFNDINSENYKINRYFGMYVNAVEEGTFYLDGQKFFTGWMDEREQLPRPETTKQLEYNSQISFPVENENGILLYILPESIKTGTGIPNSSTVSDLASIFYVKDKDENFHSLKTGGIWSTNQLRLSDTELDIGKFTGFDSVRSESKIKTLDCPSSSHSKITVNGAVPHGYTLKFYFGEDYTTITGEDNYIGQVSCDSALDTPGEAYYTYFCNKGSYEEVANSIKKAISNIVSEKKVFNEYSYENSVYLQSKINGRRSNDIRIVTNFEHAAVSTYPVMISKKCNFVGGTNSSDSRFKISKDDSERFVAGDFVKTKTGYTEISEISLFLDSYTDTGSGRYYSEESLYNVISVYNSDVYIDSFGCISAYIPFKPSFGRFSFFPVKDFDFDFLSDEYQDQKELLIEAAEYNKYDINTDLPIQKSSHPDILEFYKYGFARLQGLLTNDSSDDVVVNEVTNEYDRLKENYILELSNISKIIPYINKWVYKDGKDVRNNDYRLNFSDAFGIYNFSPSKDNYLQDSNAFTHEWYLLSKYPDYFTDSDLSSVNSYFDKRIYDNREPFGMYELVPGFFQDVDTDNFTDYFTVDRYDSGINWTLVDKQIRYSVFIDGNNNRYPEAFFRGIKVRIKKRADAYSTDKSSINYNINSIPVIKDPTYNGYKFSSILIPHQNRQSIENPIVSERPAFQIKVVENKKWKTVTFMVFLDVNYPYFDNGRNFVDRTMLYSLKSNTLDSTSYDGFIEPYQYSDTKMQGAIDFINSSGTFPGPYTIKGIEDIYGVPTNFVQDVKIGENGRYNEIQFTVIGGGGGTYIISDIDTVINADTLIARTITKNGSVGISFPTSIPTVLNLKKTEFTVSYGGYGIYLDRMKNVSFANIYDCINYGNPSVIYETVYEDGTLHYDEFIVELIVPEMIMKPIYLTRIEDTDKPVSLNLVQSIGYKLSVSENVNITPFFRHSGNFMPKAIDVIKYEDPYLDLGYDSTGLLQMTDYQTKVFNLVRNKNTRFKLNSEFGKIHDLFFHKINTTNNKSVLELSSNSAFISKYPLIGETGIDSKDFYIFNSSWDPAYYRKYISKKIYEDISGTRCMKENPTFFASKLMKTPNEIVLQTFTYLPYPTSTGVNSNSISEEVLYTEDTNKIQFDVRVDLKLRSYMYSDVYSTLSQYINPLYGYGRIDSIVDDVNEYIDRNLIARYKIKKIDLYLYSGKGYGNTDYSYLLVDDSTKLLSGLRAVNNFSVKGLDGTDINFRLIFNKQDNRIYKLGMSITVENK